MKKVRKVYLIWGALCVLGMPAAMLIAQCRNDILTTAYLVMEVVAILGLFAYALLAWRCPHCKRRLSIRWNLYDKHCPHCGKELDETDHI